jgi:hypothetical protein
MEITKIPEKVDLFELYKIQKDMIENPEYENYFKYLTKYFQRDSKKKYERSIGANDEYIFINKFDEKKRIVIEPSKYVNLESYRYEALKELNDILYQISYLIENFENITDDERSQFEILKTNYVILKKHMDEIKQIDSLYEEELNNLYENKLSKIVESTVLLQQREETFSKIESYLTIQQKNEIAGFIAKENPSKTKNIKGLSEYQQKELAKKMKLPNHEIELWMQWIMLSVQCIYVQKEMTQLNSKIEESMKKYEQEMKNFMYEEPHFEKIKL